MLLPGNIVPISRSRLRTASISESRVGSSISSSALTIVCAAVQPYMSNASWGFDFGEYFLTASRYSLHRRRHRPTAGPRGP